MGSFFPFQDLNLPPPTPPPLVPPKIEPKIEPFDDLPLKSETPPDPNPPNPPFQLPDPAITTDEKDIYAEFFRISEMFRDAFGKRKHGEMEVLQQELAIVPHMDSSSAAVAKVSNLGVPDLVMKAMKHRSAELVRVTDLAYEDHVHFREMVRRTRMVYEGLMVHLAEEEDRDKSFSSLRRTRPDLKAAAMMRERGGWLNRDKRIVGSLPGVYVGDVFFFRMEMCVIGLHGQVQAGIDYVPISQSVSGEPVATSIIVSGGYEDDEDKGDVLIYTGHGGQARNSVRQCVHQKLEGGNLALDRSRFYNIEVRVIRKVKCDTVPMGKVYVYDGLYKIIECWFDIGKSGFGVYKYKMTRLPDQPEMGSSMIKFATELRIRPLSVRPSGYLSLDISKGKEKVPISLFNDIDSDQDPLRYDYIVKPVYPPFVVPQTSNDTGCDCVSACSDGCYCAQRNLGGFPYDKNGILLRGKPLVVECGASCRCPPNCRNRVSQHGVKYRLEIFRSRETSWGVRTLSLIPAGAFICEYTGVVLPRQQAAILMMNGDSLVDPSRFPERWVEWGDISQVCPDYVRPTLPSIPCLEFAVDVSRMRNVACYLSYSATPNVFVQYVIYDHNNVSYPHIMLFALENIPPMQELSLDYGVASEWTEKLAICN